MGLPAEVVGHVFPFHFVFDAGLCIRQVGESLGRIAPDAVPGSLVTDCFATPTHREPLTLELVKRRCDEFMRIAHISTRVTFRGQFVALGGDDGWAFLGAPWFASADEVEAAGLTLNDFAAHDPIADTLLLLQTQRIAMRDLQELAANLQVQRENSRRAETLQRAAIEAANAVSYEEDFVADRYTFMGPGIRNLVGATEGEVTPKLIRDLIVETQALDQADTMSVRSVRDGIMRRRCDYRIRTRGGAERWISDSAVVTTDANGTPIGAVGILQDVTARRRFDQQLAKISSELRAILKLIPGGVVAFNH